MDHSIRRAELGDVDAIVEILAETELVKDPTIKARVEALLGTSSGTCFVAEAGSTLAGALLATFNGFHVFLSHVAVRKVHRSSGLGGELHQALVARAKEVGAIGIIADAWLTAVAFYCALGYRLPGAVFLIKDLGEEP